MGIGNTFTIVVLVVAVVLVPNDVNCFQIAARNGHSSRVSRTTTSLQQQQQEVGSTPEKQQENYATTTEDLFSLDPTSDQATKILKETLQLSEDQSQKVIALSLAVVEWNERINLVSRKDCTTSTVFGRHILPSLAAVGDDTIKTLFQSTDNSNNNNKTKTTTMTKRRVIDVGTGGGFPGLPLAIAFPETEFVLLDSVGKKLTAVQAMADQIGLQNVKTFHGRAEEYFLEKDSDKFDVATGRSVSALPQFCAWMHHLLKSETGHLVYWIGGDIESNILSKTIHRNQVQTVFKKTGDDVRSDKKMLVFPAPNVKALAKKYGIKLARRPKKQDGDHGRNKFNDNKKGKTKAVVPKGAWRKKDPNEPRQRGYENFQRYKSTTSS